MEDKIDVVIVGTNMVLNLDDDDEPPSNNNLRLDMDWMSAIKDNLAIYLNWR